MKNQRHTLTAGALLAVSAMISGSIAQADDLPQTKNRQRLAVTQGFGGAKWSVMSRTGSTNQNVVSNALIGKLRPGANTQAAVDRGILHVSGDTWTLDVSADGSAAEYRDQDVASRMHALGRPASQQMSSAALEQAGRAYIAANLSSQITLGTDEELVALRADYRTDGGIDLNTGEATNVVVANRVVFGRMIGGIPVVGNGSKVILTFGNDGALESFHYDWPTYQAGATQSVTDPSEMMTRVQKVLGARSGVTSATSRVALPNARSSAFPLVVTPNTQLQSFECGYYDSGSGSAQSIQPGCTYLAYSQDANGIRQGYAGAVPAGTQFTADPSWLESGLLKAQ